MIGFGVDVQWIVVGFPERVILSSCQIKRDIQVIHHLEVALHCNFQSKVSDYLRKVLSCFVTCFLRSCS